VTVFITGLPKLGLFVDSFSFSALTIALAGISAALSGSVSEGLPREKRVIEFGGRSVFSIFRTAAGK